MWYLTSNNDQRIIYLLPDKEITIGRSVDAQVCNFAIPDDASISRKHATFSVSGNNLFLKDLGSRYGTFKLNSSLEMVEKVEGESSVKLTSNDVIRFGKMGSEWQVHEFSCVTCTSTLKGENLQNLKLCLGKIGVQLKNEWDESCSHLTMPAITLTIKVVLALAQGSHIVTTEYWNKCLEAVNKQSKLPDPSNYTPQVIESSLNKESVSFLPNESRKKLFAGKTVVFFSKRQLDMYKAVLTKCSANALLLSETKLTKSTLTDQNVIVIQYNATTQETQTQRNQINEIVNYLKNKGKRVVADAEIGLAILYCSHAKYCNPDFNLSSEVFKQAPGQNTKPTNVLAQESQEPTQRLQCKQENVVINESLTSIEQGSNSKRKLCDQDDDFVMNASKKVATNPSSVVSDTAESGKRKFNDDNNGPSNPSKKQAVDNDDDMFNFKNSDNDNQDKGAGKKLNFSKPLKRKAGGAAANDEDELFNFVEDKSKASSGDTTKHSMFDVNRSNSKDEPESEYVPCKKILIEEKVDIEALRGSKLKELMEKNSNIKTENNIPNVIVKKEDPDDLDSKMNQLDLGTTIIKARSDLIVKKEPIEVEEQSNVQKNFKKFKKVWPIKMQVSIIPKTTTSVVIPDSSTTTEINSMSY